MAFVIPSGDSRYNNILDDIRVNVSADFLGLGDGTGGGVPVSGISFGLPDQIYSQTERVSGVEGYTLVRFTNEFPAYSRIHKDPGASVGGQILTPISALFDEVVDEIKRTVDSLHLRYYSVYEQGVVHEYNFGDANDLDSTPGVSGRLDEEWFDVPVTKDQNQFWLAPPTRFETTDSEITGLTVMAGTGVSHSGVNVLLDAEAIPPLHNRLWLNISGAREFRYTLTEDVPAAFAQVVIYGSWAQDSLRPEQTVRREQIPIDRNGDFRLSSAWRAITKVETLGLPSGTTCTLNAFNFQPRAVPDHLMSWQRNIRDNIPAAVFWQNVNADTSFSGLVQTEFTRLANAPSDISYLVRTRINTDTITDSDIEYDLIDIWKLSDRSGTALSGVLDIAPMPSARYILALDSASKIHVFDTFIPAHNMVGNTEVRESPVRIFPRWPSSNAETPSSYTVRLESERTATDSATNLSRWRWSASQGGTESNIDTDGTLYAFNQTLGWISHSSGLVGERDLTIITPGDYVFQLELRDDRAESYRTFTAHRQVDKRAINTLPIHGLTAAPTGIDFDYHGRPWVKLGDSAVRLVMRTDIGFWSVDERVLLTREPYDEVRKN